MSDARKILNDFNKNVEKHIKPFYNSRLNIINN